MRSELAVKEDRTLISISPSRDFRPRILPFLPFLALAILAFPRLGTGEELLILGDNQSHQSRGSALILQSGFSDKHITEVTRRPAGQALFGDRIFEEILKKHPDLPVLHLGDGMDVSCTSEAETFFGTIAGKRLIVVAPGNHDGYFLGNFHPESRGSQRGRLTMASWKLACQDRAYYGCPTEEVKALLGPDRDWDGRTDFDSDIPRSGEPFDRNAFIRRYLEHHGYSGSSRCGTYSAHEDRLKIVWRINEAEPWLSYLTQLAFFDSNGIRSAFLVLDTAQVRKRPKLGFLSPVAGVQGWISGAQFEAVERLIETIPSEVKIVFAGHHDLVSLRRDARKGLARLMDRQEAAVYLSGHSHEGWATSHSIGGQEVLEVNIGSILDAPIQYGLAVLARNESGPELKITKKPVEVSWGEPEPGSEAFAECKQEWRLSEDHHASPESYAPRAHIGWFKAAHRELDAQLAQMVHQWTVRPPQDPSNLCYLKDSEALADAFCADDRESILRHAREVIGMPKEEVTSRQKARLFAALSRSYGAGDAVSRRYQLCQAVDSSWRDFDRQLGSSRRPEESMVVHAPL